MKIVIVLGGVAPSLDLVEAELQDATLLIAADGGGNCLWSYGITPDYLIGDLDSISPEALDFFSKQQTAIKVYEPEKDCTDGYLAMMQALALQPQEIVMLGGLSGSRVDHLWGNIALLDQRLNKDVRVSLKDEHQKIILSYGATSFGGRCGDIFSLQAYGGAVSKLSIDGAKYPLKNYELAVGDILTLSNQILHSSVQLSFTAGRLLVFLPPNARLDN